MLFLNWLDSFKHQLCFLKFKKMRELSGFWGLFCLFSGFLFSLVWSVQCNSPLLDIFGFTDEFRLEESASQSSTCGKYLDEVCCSEEYLENHIYDYYHQVYVWYARNWKYIYSVMNYMNVLQTLVDAKVSESYASYTAQTITDDELSVWNATVDDIYINQRNCFDSIFNYVHSFLASFHSN